jgi:hypothetical protein
MKTYVKLIDDIVVYTLNSDFYQPDLIEIDFNIGKPQFSGQVFKYSTRSWVDKRSPEEIYDLSVNSVKTQRNIFLQASDWTDTASAPARLGQEMYQNWQTYRQELRDVTSQSGYPFNVVWPTPPQG